MSDLAKLQLAYKAELAKHNYTGRVYSLDPFFMNLNKEGGASIGFNEEDAHWERDDETGRMYCYCNIPFEELIALRDYLNEVFK